MIELPNGDTKRFLTLRLSTADNLVSVYAPTLPSDAEVKDQFYEDLECAVSKVPTCEYVIFLGDFNARVGTDRESWPGV
ncbi:hypothetical protein HOLleu_13605 [Holothuria leucospilota]|uniref:Craniofacial development protein 2-like n=1 Tax=Holothuria leucospilota TaxID=206669 RepID=A0A9Q1CCR1_HOLLE|nr:hypothetical protein HOLleu_13605 [Holothuria leucospilota]